MTTQTLNSPTVGSSLLTAVRAPSTLLWWSVVALTIGSIVCVAAQGLNTRTLNGVNVWLKPAKFFISLAIQFATVHWALSFLPEADVKTRQVMWPLAFMHVAGWLEMAYIIFRAWQGEASHFNTGTPIAGLMYTLMGVFAVSLTVIAGYIGCRLWAHRRKSLWHEAVALGLIFGAVLGTLAGAYMSSQTGHSVGGAISDASGTGVFGWSTTGGDLRIAHFVGLHASQIIPIAALGGKRSLVWLAVVLCCVGTGVVFAQAVAGMPLFRA
jgi:hypothetical protein